MSGLRDQDPPTGSSLLGLFLTEFNIQQIHCLLLKQENCQKKQVKQKRKNATFLASQPIPRKKGFQKKARPRLMLDIFIPPAWIPVRLTSDVGALI